MESATDPVRPPKRPRLLMDEGTADLVHDLIGFDVSSNSQDASDRELARGADAYGGGSKWGYGGADGIGGGVARFPGSGHGETGGVSAMAGGGMGNDTAAGEDNERPSNDRSGHSWESAVHSSFTTTLSSSNIATMPPPNKRKSNSLSPSKASSDTREKRNKLSQSHPAGTFGVPDLANYDPEDGSQMPEGVIDILALFSVGSFEARCFPSTPEISQILARSFRHEPIPSHARLEITTEDDMERALQLVEYAVDIHRACLQNSRKAEDEAAWYPLVRSLLSIEPPPAKSPSVVARPPRHSYSNRSTMHDLFLTIDATTKSTASDIPPKVNVKLDALIAFNPEHRICAPVLTLALGSNIQVNAFNNTILQDAIVILGVEVKSTGDSGGEMEAEYQVGVWGMKTLNLTRRLRDLSSLGPLRCDYALSLSVCGHVWSLHVSYWHGEGIVTHGPVSIGATDTLYGTMKIVAFVRRFKEWARDELWEDWEKLLNAAVAEKP